jgi:hypothetical protein
LGWGDINLWTLFGFGSEINLTSHIEMLYVMTSLLI